MDALDPPKKQHRARKAGAKVSGKPGWFVRILTRDSSQMVPSACCGMYIDVCS